MSEVLQGKYIVIEGSDGSGKGTQASLLEDYFQAMGVPAARTIEPGGTPMGDAVRTILKDESITRLAETNVDLFTLSRREAAHAVIRPLIRAGTHVIADRSYFSTIAYQCYSEGVAIDYVVSRTKEAIGELFVPDHALVLQVPFEVLEERMRKRGGRSKDYFEKRGRDFFLRVAEGYEWVCQNLGAIMIDGNRPEEDVFEDIINHIKGGNNGI